MNSFTGAGLKEFFNLTENKRFKLGYVCGDYGLIDNDEWIDLHSMSENSEKNVQICINKMNELAEENTHIKNTIKEAYNNERTQLGKSVLKQLIEVIM